MVKEKLTFANVMSTLALFVALGGVGYAAAKIDSGDIKNNAVKGKDVKDQNLTGADVRDDSLDGADINEASLGLSGPVACPAGAPNRAGDVCFSAEVAAVDWQAALAECAQRDLRLPSPGEAFRLLRATPNGTQTWTDDLGDGNSPGPLAGLATREVSGGLNMGYFPVSDLVPVRCVASPTN